MSGRKRQSRRKGQARPRLPADLRQVDWKAVNWARIDRCLARFDARSLAVLLAAAADSPGGGHRLPSLTVLWLRCLARPPAGAVRAAPAHLPQMLAAARAAAPQLRVLEDCLPADPRLLVRFPAAGQRFRVHPGSLLNPVLTMRSVAATAEAIDDFVLGRHGFRLTDLLEVALRYCDHRVGVLASAWPDRERSAGWEPLETVLTAAGLPPSWDWQFARLDEPGQASAGHYGHVFLLLADPPLVLHVQIEMNLASLGIDPAFAVGVAEGIRQTAGANPGVAAAMRAADGTPLM